MYRREVCYFPFSSGNVIIVIKFESSSTYRTSRDILVFLRVSVPGDVPGYKRFVVKVDSNDISIPHFRNTPYVDYLSINERRPLDGSVVERPQERPRVFIFSR